MCVGGDFFNLISDSKLRFASQFTVLFEQIRQKFRQESIKQMQIQISRSFNNFLLC